MESNNPNGILEQVKNNLPELEKILKEKLDWHYLELTERMIQDCIEDGDLEYSAIYLHFNVIPSDYAHYVRIAFRDTIDIISEEKLSDMEMNFMGTTLYFCYHNELMEKYEEVKHENRRLRRR